MLSSVAVFALWRSTQRIEAVPEEQGEFIVMAASPLSAALNPDIGMAEMKAAANEEPKNIKSSFEELVNDLENPDVGSSTGER